MTQFYHVHDGDFEIRPNEPKLIIGVHFLEKNAQKQKNHLFSTIGETVVYVIITQLLSCKTYIGIGLQEACKNTMFCKKLARYVEDFNFFQTRAQ